MKNLHRLKMHSSLVPMFCDAVTGVSPLYIFPQFYSKKNSLFSPSLLVSLTLFPSLATVSFWAIIQVFSLPAVGKKSIQYFLSQWYSSYRAGQAVWHSVLFWIGVSGVDVSLISLAFVFFFFFLFLVRGVLAPVVLPSVQALAELAGQLWALGRGLNRLGVKMREECETQHLGFLANSWPSHLGDVSAKLSPSAPPYTNENILCVCAHGGGTWLIVHGKIHVLGNKCPVIS